MKYSSLDEMVRNIDNQIFRSKKDKVVVVNALDHTRDLIRVTELSGKVKNKDADLSEIYVTCPPLGLLNTKDKDLFLLTRRPRRQYQTGLSDGNTQCISQVTGRPTHPTPIIRANPHWYERMLIHNEYPSVDKALEMLNDGFKAVALSKVVYLSKDDEYGRWVIIGRDGAVLASKLKSKTTWTPHVEPSALSTLGVL